ncbi:MAG: hypothetical protein JSS49_00595 [Planctomycetes bacterium]|nr:hypothetical protein [Planctomycetota bacterium]
MAIQIINCPACGTFLLEDTAECHACGHILNANLAATTKRRSLPTDQAVDEDMDVCSTCGESCRKGLVRCWNCGSFTRPEIEAAYRQRTASETVDRDFDLPELDSSSVTEVDSMSRRLATPENLLDAPPTAREENDGSDDFELSDDIQMSEADDSEFDLADEIQLRTEGSETADAAPVYSLQAPADPPPVRVSIPTPREEMETIPLLPSASNEPVGSADAPIPISPLGESAPPEAAASKEALSPEDELLKIAAAEEAEISKIRKGQRSKDSFVVYCPQGHRIRVRDKFRGKTGKCPRCAAVFIVPQKPSPQPKKKTDVEIATVGGEAGGVSGRYARWLSDVHLHNVLPEKLKLKADSLLNEFQQVDVGFSANELFVVTLVAAGGLFGGAAKKKPAARAAMLEYFANADAKPDGAVAVAKRVIPKEAYSQIVLAQPVPAGTESLFGNIPIFGTGRIAVRLPRQPEDKATQYLSFSLSEFRAFSLALQSICGIEAFGANTEIPMTEQYETFRCHYNETPVRSLQQLEYYQKDANLKLEVSGWKCGTCGLIVGEEGRKREKIGGLNGKGIAKAKCPKCSQKFGSNPMYAIPEAAPVVATAPESTPAPAPES